MFWFWSGNDIIRRGRENIKRIGPWVSPAGRRTQKQLMPNSLDLYKIMDRRSNPGGGYALRPGGSVRPDATAWAILAKIAAGLGEKELAKDRDTLVSYQLPDGRVSLTREHPATCWPTPLAILSWMGSHAHASFRQRAIAFLLANNSVTVPRPEFSGHNTELNGWSWIEKTTPWVEPTAYAIMALTACRMGDHPRVTEAVEVLLDRQFNGGGWNYGNTAAFGNALRPMATPTGIALAALKDHVPAKAVQASISYAESEVVSVRSPLSLGWLTIALTRWGRRPEGIRKKIMETLSRKTPSGPVKTDDLALLLVAFSKTGGWWSRRKTTDKGA